MAALTLAACGGGGGGGDGGDNGGGGTDDPAITVTKLRTDANDPVIEGTVLQYTVTVRNTGNVVLTNVTVNDALITPGQQTCATLAVDATCQLVGNYTVTAADVSAGQIQNTATGNSDETAAANSNTVTINLDGGGSGDVVGLDARPSNVSCIAPEAPDNGAAYALQEVFSGLGTLVGPLWLGQPPGDDSRWFFAEQRGNIFSFENTPGVSARTTVLQLSLADTQFERGLLGFAFAPDWATSGEAYVSYTRDVQSGGVFLTSVVSRFTSADGGLTLNPASEEIIIEIDHPAGNHNGGGIVFGPDGYLYLGMGDGGGIGDPFENGQDNTNLLGTFIRIDVSGDGPGYSVPPDNPNAGNPVCVDGSGSQPCPEIFAWGLRNPFRWSFDRGTGDLWAGDVGNLLKEEVSLIQSNGNYGWPIKEGSVCLDPNDNNGILPSCDDAGLIEPIIDYNSGSDTGDLGCSVIGGYVYRGTALPNLVGKYVFGDFCSGNLWTLDDDGTAVSLVDLVPSSGLRIVSFAEDQDGELYVVDNGGGFYQLVESSSTGVNTIPDLLSDTGCVDATDATQPASGLIPYAPGAPFWSDGVAKQRWLAIPDGTTVQVDDDGDFVFPQGTILVKNFERAGELIETRLFMRHSGANDVWAGYTYRWNDTQTDAERIVGGATLEAGGSDWIYPSEAQCLACHTEAAGRSLGLEVAQQNNDLLYPSTGRTANQLATLDGVDVVAPLADPATLPAFPDPFGSAPLEERARAYLHTNCSGCHRPGTPLQATLDLRYDTPLSDTNACNADSVTGGDLGISGAKLILPGDASRSLIPLRMDRRDASQMPPIGSLLVDDAGVDLINAWIDSLSGC